MESFAVTSCGPENAWKTSEPRSPREKSKGNQAEVNPCLWLSSDRGRLQEINLNLQVDDEERLSERTQNTKCWRITVHDFLVPQAHLCECGSHNATQAGVPDFLNQISVICPSFVASSTPTTKNCSASTLCFERNRWFSRAINRASKGSKNFLRLQQIGPSKGIGNSNFCSRRKSLQSGSFDLTVSQCCCNFPGRVFYVFCKQFAEQHMFACLRTPVSVGKFICKQHINSQKSVLISPWLAILTKQWQFLV